MEYRGLESSDEYSERDQLFFGKVLVTFGQIDVDDWSDAGQSRVASTTPSE